MIKNISGQDGFVPLNQIPIDTLAWDIFRGTFYVFWSPDYWINNWTYLLIAVFYFSFVFVTARYVWRIDSSKNEAWVLSVSSSIVCFALSIPLFVMVMYQSMVFGPVGARDAFLSRRELSDFLANLFMVFTVYDTITSAILYPESFEIMTGWIHHIIYFGLMNNALAWGYTVGVMSFFVEELPTFILALGRLFPDFRSDAGFGVTFVITRIIYHALGSVLLTLYCRAYSLTYIFAIWSWTIHVWWFTKWLIRMYRVDLNRKALGLEESESVVLVPTEDAEMIDPEICHPPINKKPANIY